MGKTVYRWSRVEAGDIISFRYRGLKTPDRKTAQTSKGGLTTILVLNPKMRVMRKDGTTIFHLIGLQLEKEGVVPHIKNKEKLVELLNRVGNFEPVDVKNKIFRIRLKSPGAWGFNESSYEKLKGYFRKEDVYRTYLWDVAKNSSVFLEPIALPGHIDEVLGFNIKADVVED